MFFLCLFFVFNNYKNNFIIISIYVKSFVFAVDFEKSTFKKN